MFLRWHWELQHPASLLKHVAFCVLTDNNKTRSFAYFYVLFTTPPFLFAGPPAVPWTLLVVLRLSEVCSQLDFWQSLNHYKIKTQQQQQQHFSKKLTRNSIVKCDGWEKERWWISPFLPVPVSTAIFFFTIPFFPSLVTSEPNTASWVSFHELLQMLDF